MISIKEVTYKNFGKCLSLTNDLMELLVTVNIGPRIIKCNLRGKENMMYEDIDRVNVTDASSVYGEGKNWYIYGGHRLWLSPESLPETYYPDNDRVLYSTCSTGAEFTPPVQSVRNLQFSVFKIGCEAFYQCLRMIYISNFARGIVYAQLEFIFHCGILLYGDVFVAEENAAVRHFRIGPESEISVCQKPRILLRLRNEHHAFLRHD